MQFGSYTKAIILSSGIGLLATMASAQVVTLSIDSQIGDGIGQGQHKTIVYTPGPPNDNFWVNNFNFGGTSSTSYIEFILGTVTSSNTTNTYALFVLGTNKLGHELQPGFYDNVERAAFASNGHPGLDFSWQNRGTNTVVGNFTIHSVHFKSGPNGFNVVDDLDVSFEQWSEASTAPCRGRLTYFSSPVPEPASMAILGIGSLVLLRRRRK